MSQKPVIGIVTVHDESPIPRIFTNEHYPKAVIRGGGIPVMLPVTTDREVLQQFTGLCDGFLFSGGQDISPMKYGELQSRLCGSTSLLLDDFQIPLMQMVLESRKPFVAICRGIQVLNVALGGTLYQDVTEYSEKTVKHIQEANRGDVTHPVEIQEGTQLYDLFGGQIWTNSFHHQALKKVAERLTVSARCPDGIVEAVEVKDYPYGMGIQWHPEGMLPYDDAMLPLFQELVRASISKAAD